MIWALVLSPGGCASSRKALSETERLEEVSGRDSLEAVSATGTLLEAGRTESSRSGSHRLLVREEMIPGTEARLTLPAASLLELPEGAGYGARDGRSSVRIERHGDGFEITGTCDSISRRCLYLEDLSESETHRADSLQLELTTLKWTMEGSSTLRRHEAGESRNESGKPPNLFCWAIVWLAAGIIAGGTLSFLAIRKLNR